MAGENFEMGRMENGWYGWYGMGVGWVHSHYQLSSGFIHKNILAHVQNLVLVSQFLTVV